jgi:hypothetical protein
MGMGIRVRAWRATPPELREKVEQFNALAPEVRSQVLEQMPQRPKLVSDLQKLMHERQQRVQDLDHGIEPFHRAIRIGDRERLTVAVVVEG